MRRIGLGAALALLLGATAAIGQEISATVLLPCVARGDAEALVASVLPELLQQAGKVCADTLPPGALLRQQSGGFIDRYRAEADRAWPQGSAAIAKLAAPEIAPILGSGLARPLLATLIAPLLTNNLKPADCPSIDRIVTLAEPLPPHNMAGMLVAVLQLIDANRRDKGNKSPLSICQQDRR